MTVEHWHPARALLSALAIAVTACLPAGHREYQPLSAYERDASAGAARAIFPEDVRSHLDTLRDKTVAWAGIVKRAQVERNADRLVVTIEVEHHYYDWIESYSPSAAPIWLSPLGEGRIRVVWDVMKDTPDDALATITTEDNLVLVYGVPTAIDGPRVVLRGRFVRGIDRRHYDTRATKYGREAVPRK
jgi:hypothetical protein